MGTSSASVFLFAVACLRPLVWITGGIVVWRFGARMPRPMWTYFRVTSAGMLLTAAQSFVVQTSALDGTPIHWPVWVTDAAFLIGLPANLMIVLGLVLAMLVGLQERRQGETNVFQNSIAGRRKP